MLNCWNRLMGPACWVDWLLAAGCGKPAAESPPPDARTPPESAEKPEAVEPAQLAGRKPPLDIVIQYTPPSTKAPWEESEWVLAVRDGQITEVDLATVSPEMQQWLSDRGVPVATRHVAKD